MAELAPRPAALAALPVAAPPLHPGPPVLQRRACRAARKLVAITACPTGIAHTFMAAEALKKAAADAGYDIKVETQGSVGAKNTLTDEEIAEAEAVIIGADTHVTLERFTGKARLLRTSVGDALKAARRSSRLFEALALPVPQGEPARISGRGRPLPRPRARPRRPAPTSTC